MNPTEYFNQLNNDYIAVHGPKEQLFWTTYMGVSDDHSGCAAAETRWNEFIANGQRIPELREQLAKLDNLPATPEMQAVKKGLQGWLTMYECNAIESLSAQQQKAALIKSEVRLFEKRQKYAMFYTDAQGRQVEASMGVLRANIYSDKNAAVRQSSHRALLDLEDWVLENGYIELVKQRNQFARSLGYSNFFDYSIEKTEQMSTEQLFTILDDFELRTRDRNLQSIAELAAEHGNQSLEAHNFNYTWGGDAMRELDPYVPFAKSLRQWVESFGRLNIDYSSAELTLDLLDRKGKYQNGFCHGPMPCYFDNAKWVAGKINFTSNAKPDQVGSGYDGLNTLFHEGGHAAHFANVTLNSPCFSHEFAPTSMAYAETQSMFCDSLLGDADWLKLYAKNAAGESVPDKVLRSLIESKQPFRAFGERNILLVPYFEQALYATADDQLSAAAIKKLARDLELKITGLAVSPRPLLAIPHLLSNDSACSYQGYLLANMAVYQTRAYFMQRFGYLTDNPEIGPLLAKHYWNAGNSVDHAGGIKSLTGEGFNPKYLAGVCNLSVAQAWAEDQARISAIKDRPRAAVKLLNACVTIVDGVKVLADNRESNSAMCDQFEAYIKAQY
ncbi:MAG: M3 family metallopeptidase [Pseudomonadales bacterium]|nr:M3 family metallopeptidase [Pseudomonadales bacterium]NRA14114.1 M3 family oligoendopeptidase [Oceanospirillaceae bacterium]